jgi:hypothetical protein
VVRAPGIGVFIAAFTLACDRSTLSDPPPETLVTPSLTIGGEESGPQSFSRVSGLVADASGRVYIADAGELAIRIFDRDGRFVRSVGRPGRGPGEFVDPTGLALVGDELFVYDPEERRLSVFDTAGAIRRQHIIPVSSFGLSWEGGIDSVGRLVDLQVVPVNDSVNRETYRRLDLATGATDSGTIPDCGIPMIPRLDLYVMVVDVPFAPGRVVWLDPDLGTWCANSGAAIAWRIPFGDSIPRDSVVSWVQPAPVTQAARDSAIEVANRNLARVGLPNRIDGAGIPPTKPVVRVLTRDDRGRIWLLLHDERGDVFHVFSTERRWIARVRPSVRIIARTGSIAIVRDQLWAVGLDSLDVPVVLRFEVPLPGDLP